MNQLASYKSPHDLYKFLVLRNDENLKSSIEELYDNLCTFKISSAYTLREDLDKFLSLLCRVRSAQGEWNISESQAQLHMLRALPQELRCLRGIWSISDGKGSNGLRDHLVRQAKIHLESNPQYAAKAFRKNLANKKESKDGKDKVCTHCKKKGHSLDKCYAYKESKGDIADLPAWYSNRKNKSVVQQKKSPWSAMARASPILTAYKAAATVGMVESCNQQIVWELDTGSSQHFVYDRSVLTNYTEINDNHTVTGVGGAEFKIAGVGIVTTDKFILHQVFHVPEFKENLLSLFALLDKGIEHRTVAPNKLVFSRDGVDGFIGHVDPSTRRGTLVTNVVVRQASSFAKAVTMQVIRGSLFDVHKQLGHISYDRIIKLSKISSAIALTDNVKVPCSDCMKAKICDATHRTRSTPKQIDPAAALHFDTFGPIKTIGLDGQRFGVIGKDEASKFRFFEAVKSKEDVKNVVMRVITFLKLTLNLSVLSIISDNGTEYVNNELKCFLDSRGILHIRSHPYCPQQNGFVEREVRTISELARTVINASKLPSKLWPQACEYACYILNRSLTNQNTIPIESLTGKPVAFQYHCAFGTRAFILNHNNRGKFDNKGDEVFCVGHTDRINTLKFYDKLSNKIVISSQFTLTNETNDEDLLGVDSNEVMFIDFVTLNHPVNTHQLEKQAEKSKEVDLNLTFELPSHSQQDILNVQMQSDNVANEPDIPNVLLQSDSAANETEIGDVRDGPLFGDRILTKDWVMPCDTMNEEPVTSNRESVAWTFDGNEERNNRPLRPRKEVNYSLTRPYVYHRARYVTTNTDDISFEVAMASNDKERWLEAMGEEMSALQRTGTYSLVTKPPNANVINVMWVLRRKLKPNGELDRARLVAKGFQQKYGIDYMDTYSPVACASIIRCLFVAVVQYDMQFATFDVKTAFLNAELSETIFVQQPKGFSDDSQRVWKLNRTLYGLKQSSLMWSRTFTKKISKLGFKPLQTQACVFLRNDPFSVLVIYVDDGLVIAKNNEVIDSFLSEMECLFDIHRCDGKSYLGFQIHRLEDKIIINQETFIRKCLDKFMLDKSRVANIPMTKYSVDDDSTLLEEPNNFRQILGTLLYAAETSRLDIYYAVNQISRHQASQRVIDANKLQDILAYLNNTKSMGIMFSKVEYPLVELYTDADLAGDPITGCSTSGYVMLYCKSPVIWKSRRQKMVATSSCFAETVAVFQALEATSPHIETLEEVGLEIKRPVTLYCDNISVIYSASQTPANAKTRLHLTVKRKRIKEAIDNKEVELTHVTSEKQLADVFTKCRRLLCLSNPSSFLCRSSFFQLFWGQNVRMKSTSRRSKI